MVYLNWGKLVEIERVLAKHQAAHEGTGKSVNQNRRKNG
jgi:hypothetical protein